MPDQTASESCQSSDDDSDIGAQAGALMNSSAENQSLLTEMFMPIHSSMQAQQSIAAPFHDNFDFEVKSIFYIRHISYLAFNYSRLYHLPFQVAIQLDNINALPAISSMSTGYNEDLAEADQSRPNASNDQQVNSNEKIVPCRTHLN